MTASQETAGSGAQMLTALVRLRGALQAAELPLDAPGADEQRGSRAELVDQLEDYVIPRVMTVEAPLLVVVGGSTGAGKSTLVNSLVGRRVTEPGLLRPTTRSPVLVHHPDDAAWFGQDRLLPDLRRVDHPTNDHDALQLVAAETVPAGLAILDAPDVDSVEEPNRVLAAQLLAAADMWLFVTSAARYADQVPWEHLKAAAQRSAAVAIVLDRTAADAVQTVSTHLARMLASRGLKDSPLFIVHEGPIDQDGLLPRRHVAEVRAWLASLAVDTSARDGVVRQTLEGSIRAITRRAHPVADAVAAQVTELDVLRADVATAYDEAGAALVAGSGDGTLLQGEVLARWEDFVGTGELLRSLEDKVGWLRERVVNAVKGKPQQAERVMVAVESGLENLILERAETTAAALAATWREKPAGAGVLAGSAGLERAGRELRRTAERAVRDWQQDVTELVRLEGSGQRTARFLAYGVQGLSVALMVSALDQASTQPSSAAGRSLLDAVFGPAPTADLVARARDTLEYRLGDLVETERRRWTAVLDALPVSPDAAAQLRQAARRVDDVRFASVPRSDESTD
ncbi:dynamin family protein [Nocardioides lianchengensis]|uniref:Dynamin family protein n=1 Tax=Nocardioides lianchengensis TaxID=1045774 RepID=A0A1G6UM49_9ACTN|nr:GTPase domain-containing protein [Nocardioides lianchengensis]NYG10974.1 energy-coupling factor transporter ATP-binding protein EcfA2 [Nocardioides lianchengensis]SDD42334.1 Dynamin family protein [Nocardioides lianchengensis]